MAGLNEKSLTPKGLLKQLQNERTNFSGGRKHRTDPNLLDLVRVILRAVTFEDRATTAKLETTYRQVCELNEKGVFFIRLFFFFVCFFLPCVHADLGGRSTRSHRPPPIPPLRWRLKTVPLRIWPSKFRSSSIK
jgi:hypothetical protein